MDKANIGKQVEYLLKFALDHKLIKEFDIIPSRNALMDLLHMEEPYTGEIDEEPKNLSDILNNILDYAYMEGIISKNTVTWRDLLDTRIMGLLMPRQSEVIENFLKTSKEKSIIEATDDYYRLSEASNYIRMDRIYKNLYWKSKTDYGSLEITVNLSKPEKDPEEIAAEIMVAKSSYPKCLLCLENVGYVGRVNHPARQNHRVIPLTLNKERWYFQYSPYVYYNEHCIVFYEEHTPMRIDRGILETLVDFIEQFPHYFIGSNADIPIVGGSILSHEHFQGGRHVFPMEEAGVEEYLSHPKYDDVFAGILKWPMPVFRISSKNKTNLINLASDILDMWRDYSDESVGIISHTIDGCNKIIHNTITPIARKNSRGEFEMDLVLRNNLTSSLHPLGIFHPHRELNHIKKENIGLIEVMGLAVLPGRLNKEMEKIKEILTGREMFEVEKISEDNELYKHVPWIEEMIEKHGTALNNNEAETVLKQEVGDIFLRVLMDAGVYKRNSQGRQGFNRFIKAVGFERK